MDINSQCKQLILQSLQKCQIETATSQILDTGNHNILSAQIQTLRFEASCIDPIELQTSLIALLSPKITASEIQKAINQNAINTLVSTLNSKNLTQTSDTDPYIQALLLNIGGYPLLEVEESGESKFKEILIILFILISLVGIFIIYRNKKIKYADAVEKNIPLPSATFV